MKTIFKFFAFILILLIILVVIANISNTISLETSFFSLKANVGFLILFCSVLGSVATISLGISLGWYSKSDQNKLKKSLENTKLNYEIELEKIKQLEAKVRTLEEALKMATKM